MKIDNRTSNWTNWFPFQISMLPKRCTLCGSDKGKHIWIIFTCFEDNLRGFFKSKGLASYIYKVRFLFRHCPPHCCTSSYVLSYICMFIYVFLFIDLLRRNKWEGKKTDLSSFTYIFDFPIPSLSYFCFRTIHSTTTKRKEWG